MAAVIGALRIDLSASVAQFAQDMAGAGKQLEAFGKKAKSVAQDLTRLGTTLSLALTLPVVALGVSASKVATEAAQATGQVDAALKSMGNTSGRTSAQLEKQADALAHVSTYTRVDIMRNVTAGLLRFGNVQGPIFDRAQKDILDLSARMGVDLPAATSLVGRALQDPISGLQRLTRSGIQFTEAQKEQIKQLVLSGQGFKAQDLILTSLEAKFGGAALAMRQATPGADVKEAWHDFEGTLGRIVNQVLPPITALLTKVLDAFVKLPPGIQKGAVELLALGAVVGPVIAIFGGLIEAVATIAESVGGLAGLFEGVGAAAAGAAGAEGLGGLLATLGPIGAALGAVVAFVVAFKDTFVAALREVWDQAQATIGPAFASLATAFGNVWSALTTGPVGEALTYILQGLADLLAWLLKIFGGTLAILIGHTFQVLADGLNGIADLLHFVGDLLSGNFSKAWIDWSSLVVDIVAGVIRTVALLIPALDGVADKLDELRNKTQQPQGAPVAPGPVLGPFIKDAPAPPPIKPPVFNTGRQGGHHAAKANPAGELQSSLTDLGQGIYNATNQVPEAITKADEFNKKLADMIEKATKAKVNMAAFAATIANLKAQIAAFRTTELAREAEKFAKAVDGDTRAVNEFGKGGVDPLTEKLQAVDDQYNSLHDQITEQIEANRILAGANAEAAAAMARLKVQLADLEKAHASATAAAKAQYAAEEHIAGLQNQSAQLKSGVEIRDFQNAASGSGPVGSAATATQKAQDELDQKRLDLETQIATLESERDDKLRTGDLAAASRLTANIDLQTKFLNLVNDTTADQLAGQQRIDSAWSTFSDNLSTAIQDLGTSGKSAEAQLKKTVADLLKDAIIKPFADQAAGSITSTIKSALGLGGGSKPDGSSGNPFHVVDASTALGGSADGGTGGFNLSSILQNPLGSLTQGFQSLMGTAGAGGSVGTGISSAVSGIASFFSSFLGGFAGGGQFGSGWGVVGENGPELWAPNRTGYVIPNSDLAAAGHGGMTAHVTYNVQTPDVGSFAASDRQLARQTNTRLRQLGGK